MAFRAGFVELSAASAARDQGTAMGPKPHNEKENRRKL
jgi:hypothetical protein